MVHRKTPYRQAPHRVDFNIGIVVSALVLDDTNLITDPSPSAPVGHQVYPVIIELPTANGLEPALVAFSSHLALKLACSTRLTTYIHTLVLRLSIFDFKVLDDRLPPVPHNNMSSMVDLLDMLR